MTGVQTCALPISTAIADLRDRHLRQAATENFGRYGVPLLDLLAEQPLMTAGHAVEKLGAAPTTIGSLLDKATKLGIVEEITGQKRNRVYRYSPFLDLFTSEDTPGSGAAMEVTL